MTVVVDRRDDVARVLEDDALTVRPPREPVPRHLVGTALGELFARFARMNDGARHAELRAHADERLRTLTIAAVEAAALRIADLVTRTAADDDGRRLFLIRFVYPAAVVASLLGVADADVLAVAANTRRVVRAVAAASAADAAADGSAALASIVAAFARSEQLRLLSDDARANAIGLMFQSVDGCAGLIGNALVHVARANEQRDARAFITDVAVDDAAIHTTRRYTSEGETMLVRLGAGLPFGAGAHACPGREIALTIAAVGVATLLAAEVDVHVFAEPAYQASVNARIPVCPTDGAFA